MKKMLILSLLLLLLSGCSTEQDTIKANKELVTSFYKEVLFQGKYQAVDKYIGDKYIQHNPHVPDGKQALVNFVKSMIPESGKIKPYGEIVRVIAEGDLVMLHIKCYSWPSKNGGSLIDIFRVKDGKIVEHWDTVQAIPDKSANENTMF